MVLTLIATISMGNAYAIEGDGTSHVEVDEYPFNITVEEGGSMTLHNNGENTINFVSHGWFDGTVPANDAIRISFPAVNCGTTCFVEGMYYISDLNGMQQSTIEIVKPYVEPPPYVAPPAPVVVEPTPEPVVEPTPEPLPLQTQRAEVTSKFNESITKLADQKVAIENHNNKVQSLNTQIGSLNTTATSVSELEQSILSLQLEKEDLNAQIVSLGNQTAIQLATIESLQSDTTLDVKVSDLESQIVTLNIANVTATTTIAELNAKIVSASDTSILDGKIANLEAQVVTLTNDRDQWKQLANNWYAVAMDQLKVMVDVLGL